jgi:hypothetical protein
MCRTLCHTRVVQLVHGAGGAARLAVPGDYIRTRSARRPGDSDIGPEWADEAFADDDALAGLARPGVEVG